MEMIINVEDGLKERVEAQLVSSGLSIDKVITALLKEIDEPGKRTGETETEYILRNCPGILESIRKARAGNISDFVSAEKVGL